jgi:RNA polymerase sigma factor (sigma-70 family)
VLPEELYTDLYPLLRELAEEKYRVPEYDSHDVVHDLFIRFAHTREPIENVRSFLIASLRNACVDYWREKAKFDRDTPIPERSRTPRYERVDLLRRVLRKLPRLERRVFVLRLQGWRVKEIARRLGISKRLAEKVLRRARKAVAEDTDLTNRCGKGRRPRRTVTYLSERVAIMRAHVRPVRGPALPRAAARASVLSADRRPAWQVRGEFSAACGMVPASRRGA